MNATERALHDALHGLVAQPHLPDALADRVAVSYGRRRRRRGAMTVAAVAAGVSAIVALPGFGRAPRPQPPATASPSPSFTRGPAPDGPRVAATGTVVAAPGQPVRFCDLSEVVTNWPWPPPTPEPPSCSFSGVEVVGVDLGALPGRDELNGTVFGKAWLRGVYRDGTLTVVEQDAPRAVADTAPRMSATEHPCPTPPGGWVPDSPHPQPAGDGTTLYDQPSLGALDRFADANPGEIVYVRYIIPVPNHSVVMTAVRDVAKVEAALRPVYGTRICIVRSRYTKDEVRQTRRAFDRFRETPEGRAAGVWGAGESQTPQGQPRVDVKATIMTPALERFLTEYPPGLVHVNLWLRPA